MYTAIKLGHTDDKQTQRRIVTIKFEDISIPHEFVKDFSFRLTDTLEVMKGAVAAYLTELNAVPDVLADGVVDTTVATPVEVVPTADELARTEWEADRNKLKTLMELVRDGVFTGSETQITALQAKVKTGFKVGYLG